MTEKRFVLFIIKLFPISSKTIAIILSSINLFYTVSTHVHVYCMKNIKFKIKF